MAAAELATLARPYARALFSQALAGEGQGGLAGWSRLLALLAAAAEAPPVQLALGSPLASIERKLQVFAALLEDELSEAGRNFITLLAEQGRLALLPTVAALFEQLRAEHDKTLEVSVQSAYPLGEQQAAQLKEALGRKLQRDIRLSASESKALIGGVRVQLGDTVIDGSIRGRLDKLAQALA